MQQNVFFSKLAQGYRVYFRIMVKNEELDHVEFLFKLAQKTKREKGN